MKKTQKEDLIPNHIGQKLAELIGCTPRIVYRFCSALEMKLRQQNDYNSLSYEQLKEGFKTCDLPGSIYFGKRGAFKRNAQERFPEIFKSKDFPPILKYWKRKYTNYKIIVEVYKLKVQKLSKMSPEARYSMSSVLRALYFKAKEYFPKEFREKDFQKTDFRRTKKYTYSQSVSLYAESQDRTDRSHYKVYAKRNYPQQFKESDFPFKKERKYSILTYKQFIKAFAKETCCAQRGMMKKMAKMKYEQEFNEKDFPSLKPYYKYSYEQLKKEFVKEIGVAKYSIRRKARLYMEFKEGDFPYDSKYIKYSKYKYQELVSLYKQTKDGITRATIKQSAQRFLDQFKMQDFPRMKKRLIEYSYLELVQEFKNLSKKQKLKRIRSMEQRRSNIKLMAQELFLSQFSERDFPRIHLTA